jgi:hypothetical protein
VVAPESFYVSVTMGPLLKGAREPARRWDESLGRAYSTAYGQSTS